MAEERKRSFLDDAIAWLAPQTACKREAWRQQYENMRGYDAAGSGRLNANWRVANEAAEYTDRPARDTIRARARDLERNSDMANGILSAFNRNVVGHGFKLQATTGDEELNKLIEKEWNEWTKKRFCDVTGQQSFNSLIRMAVRRKKVDGGMLFLKCYSGHGKIPFQLQALEVDELSSTQYTPKNPKNKVIGGVELDKSNKPVGYWIDHYQLDGWSISEPTYYDAKRIIFLWQKNRPSQVREMSDFAPTLTRIRDSNEFITAVSVKERIAACLAVFIKKLLPTGGGFGGRALVQNEEGKLSYSGKMLSPGMIQELNPGDEIQVVDPKGSYGEAEGMLKIEQRLVAAAHGLSYEAISRDMSGVNYSSARQSSIEDALTISEDVDLIIEVMDEIYETFIISGYLAGVFNMPGLFDSRDKKLGYFSHKWVASPKPWIDPMKEANANKVALQTAQKTYAQICAEQGYDWREQLDEIAQIKAYAQKLGIDIGGGDIYSWIEPSKKPTPSDSGDSNEE